MKEIHKQITEQFSKSFSQFVDIQSNVMDMIGKMPEKDAKMFQSWMLNLNEGMLKQDSDRILNTIEQIKNYKNQSNNGNSKVSK